MVSKLRGFVSILISSEEVREETILDKYIINLGLKKGIIKILHQLWCIGIF